MFKGLRTKIESEQKGQTIGGPKPLQKGAAGRTSDLDGKTAPKSSILIDAETKSNINDGPLGDMKGDKSISIPSEELPITDKPDQTLIKHDPSNTPSTYLEQLALGQSVSDFSANNYGSKTTNELDSQVIKLKDQLRNVMDEKDEISRQKEQTYQIIEALERELEQQKAKNIILETKLSDYESKSKEQKPERLNKIKSNGSCTTNDTSSKSFNPEGHVANSSDIGLSDNVEVLRNEIIELQAQLAKKNRQLKIRQQNLTDMKKALQREILDHSKTQDELARLQKLLKRDESAANLDDNNKQTISESNPRKSSDTLSSKNDLQQHEIQTDTKQADDGQKTSNMHSSNVAEDTVSLNATMASSTVQFDRISYLSRSSASVDDFESNDLQHNNNNNKEVSHEYLRNVLFRYMTSTNTETTQHLVKAISVLMDFTPEQSAAIMSSMNGRMPSWLRLK
jgi:hypothetical protein